MNTNFARQDRVSTLWILLLTLTSTATTLALGCAMPFAALAALAALYLRQRDGLILLLLAWSANQAVGFGLMNYPHDPKTLAWGIGLATAAIGSGVSAYAALARLPHLAPVLRTGAAFIAAFVAFKAVVLVWALVLGGVGTTLSPFYASRQFVRDGAILVGLLALYRAVVWAGLPKPIVPSKSAWQVAA
ncbi:MAG: hypothetical protein JWQ16_2694 [Novosphingobium sp.]|nr:hypothetical protein [Novosphingobium sp.]